MKRLAIALALLSLSTLLALAAACGDDDDGGNGDGTQGSTEPGPDFLLEDVESLVMRQIERINNELDGDFASMSDDELRDTLEAMVLQDSDIPAEMQSLGGSFSTNADTAAGGLGGGPTEEQLDEWGRILGYQIDFQRTTAPEGANITALSTSISVYEAADGAGESFDDRVERARAIDWEVNYDLTEYDERELTPDLPVDALYWLRITGFERTTPDTVAFVADDQVLFRIGPAWGFVRSIATGPTDR